MIEKILLNFARLLNIAQLCSTLLDITRHCSTLLGIARLCSTLLNFAWHYSTLLGIAQHYSTLTNDASIFLRPLFMLLWIPCKIYDTVNICIHTICCKLLLSQRVSLVVHIEICCKVYYRGWGKVFARNFFLHLTWFWVPI